jgi:hypothetical protein
MNDRDSPLDAMTASCQKSYGYDCRITAYLCNQHRRQEEVGENGKNIWIWITSYERSYGKNASVTNRRRT